MSERSKEIEWIFSVLDEATLDLKTLCLLTPAAMTPNLKDIVGPETAFLLQDYMEVAHAYEEFMSFPYEEQRQEEANALAEAVADSLRAICRVVHKDPALLSQIKRDKTIIKKPWFGMINALFEYTDLVRKKLGHLHADGMDDATADQRLEELLQTQREAEARETELRDVLRTERQTRGDHQQHAQSKGEKLQRELARLQQQANARHQFVAGAADDETKAENERHTKTVQELQAEIARLTKTLGDGQRDHAARELDLKRRLVRVDDELTKTIGDYDYNMLEKTKQYAKLREMFTNESLSLKNVSAQVTALQAEREEYERQQAEEAARQKELSEKRFHAAVTIQRMIRGWLVRLRIKKEKAAAAAAAAKKSEKSEKKKK